MKIRIDTKMREIYYGFYKELSYQHLLLISLSELLIKNIAYFQNDILHFKRNSLINKIEKKIIGKICITNRKSIYLSDLRKWYIEIRQELIEKNYLELNIFKKYKFTKYFKERIKHSITYDFNRDILQFIKCGKINMLKPIFHDINNLKIPKIITDYKNISLIDYYNNEFINIYKTSSRFGSHGRTYDLLQEINRKFKNNGA